MATWRRSARTSPVQHRIISPFAEVKNFALTYAPGPPSERRNCVGGMRTVDSRSTDMSVYKRGGVWWYKFKFAGQLIRESTKSTNRNIAPAAERTRHAELENGFNRVGKRTRPQLFTVAAAQWLKSKTTLSPRSVKIEQLNLKHL